MTRKEKIQHFKDYYLAKMLTCIVVVAFFGYVIFSIVKPDVETVLYAAVLDGCIDAETISIFETDMIERLGLDTDESTVFFDSSFYLNSSDTYASTNIEKLVVYVAAADIDIMIGPEESLSQYANAGYFTPMSECLPTDLFSILTDNFYYSTTEDSDELTPYGIYLEDYATYDDYGNVVTCPIVCIVANSKYKDNAVTFIESLNLD